MAPPESQKAHFLLMGLTSFIEEIIGALLDLEEDLSAELEITVGAARGTIFKSKLSSMKNL